MHHFSIVVATLRRPSYARLVQSITNQDYADWELVARYDPEVNEYVSRNRAVKEAKGKFLLFTDDDCIVPAGYLRTAAVFTRRHNPVAVSGPLQGNMWGTGTMRVEAKGWGIGANLIVRRDAFEAVGGFEEDWGLGHAVKGWRADTDLWWKLEDKYHGRVAHAAELVMQHPEMMKAQWIPEVEDVFFRRWRARVMERFVPVDPRLQQFLLETQDLEGGERDQVLKARAEMREKIPSLPVLETEDKRP